MYRRLVLVVAACAVVLVVRELEAGACGVKLTIKAPRVNRTPDQSSNPSRILLLGDPPRSLSKELIGRGHKVEVAGSADEARRVRYHAIVADSDHEGEARSRWPGALIVVRKGSAKENADLVDQQLGSMPNRALIARTPERTSRDERAPIRVGPPREDQREAVAAGGSGGGAVAAASGGGPSEPVVANEAPTTTPPAPATPSDDDDDTARPAAAPKASKRVAAVDTSAREKEPSETAEEPSAAPARGRFSRRVYFAPSSSSLNPRMRARLSASARWLQRHADRSVVVEGHASTTGPAEPNQILSQARADSVKAFLVEQGVDESRIQTEAFGLTKPEFQPGSNPKNRRAVLRLAD
jgi:outer membrane protein OmpA-like peptidoglycan-associated protein